MRYAIVAITALMPCTLIAQAAAPKPITVSLTPVVPTAGMGLRWSPKGAAVPLKATAPDTLTGSFTLGPAGSAPIAVKLAIGANETHYNTLWIDFDRDGRLTDNEKIIIVPKDTRGKWWSSFDTVINVPVAATEGHAATARPYPLSLWYVDDPAWYIEDPAATDIPQTMRWSRRGWHMGKVDIGGKPAYVVIDEYEMDGVFDQRDAWALSRDSAAALKADERDLDKHAWLDGVAYRPVKIDPDGRSITFVEIKTGTTEAQEAAAKDTYLPDRNVERAAQPVPFGHDLSTALVDASRNQSRILVDFEAVWCGPCHTMDQLVFTAQSVVTAAGGVSAVKVDGDVHPDLKKKYNVDGYPTLILLDSHGKEIRRGVGYQSVLEMLALLKP